MSAVPKPRKMTVEEYFAIEEKADRKSEFFDGEMFLMAGASREHNIVLRNLVGEIYILLKGSKCQVFFNDLRLKVGRTGLYTYPDLLIVCEKPEFAPENRNTLTNPTLVIEVLSESTERYDRTTKFRFYKRLPSLKEYILVTQDEPLVERYVRNDDGSWAQTDFEGLENAMSFASVPVKMPLADVYRGVEFPARLFPYRPDPADDKP
jgi:Uma2 family endonuclease